MAPSILRRVPPSREQARLSRLLSQQAPDAARALIGCVLVRRRRGRTLEARIVEAEAYLGEVDAAAHVYRGPHTAHRAALRAARHALRLLRLRHAPLPEHRGRRARHARLRADPRGRAAPRKRDRGARLSRPRPALPRARDRHPPVGTAPLRAGCARSRCARCSAAARRGHAPHRHPGRPRERRLRFCDPASAAVSAVRPGWYKLCFWPPESQSTPRAPHREARNPMKTRRVRRPLDPRHRLRPGRALPARRAREGRRRARARPAAVLDQGPARGRAAQRATASWSPRTTSATWRAGTPAAPKDVELPFMPARVILQDFTGVPASSTSPRCARR